MSNNKKGRLYKSLIKKPKLHGCDPNLLCNSIQCNRLKVDKAFAGVKAKNWTDTNLLAEKFAKVHGLTMTSEDALEIIYEFFNFIALKNPHFASLATYCVLGRRYLKQKHIAKLFKSQYKSQVEDLEINRLKDASSKKSYRNGIKLSLRGADRFYKELEVTCFQNALLSFARIDLFFFLIQRG
jgi:hypothetical protein